MNRIKTSWQGRIIKFVKSSVIAQHADWEWTKKTHKDPWWKWALAWGRESIIFMPSWWEPYNCHLEFEAGFKILTSYTYSLRFCTFKFVFQLYDGDFNLNSIWINNNDNFVRWIVQWKWPLMIITYSRWIRLLSNNDPWRYSNIWQKRRLQALPVCPLGHDGPDNALSIIVIVALQIA